MDNNSQTGKIKQQNGNSLNLTMFMTTEILQGQKLHMLILRTAERKLLSLKEGYTDSKPRTVKKMLQWQLQRSRVRK